MILSVTDVIGRFHPVFVHLPIGILLLACFFQLLTIKARFAALKPAIPMMLFWGTLSALLSCITGYLLSLTGDYDATLVGRHQWMGIFTLIASLALYLVYKFSLDARAAHIFSIAIIVLTTLTGHMGGSLTHGSDYLTEGLNNDDDMQASTLKPIPNIQEAAVYADVVQPLLESKCYSCHGPNKQKGKLRLDQQAFILKGGKEGKALIAGDADESAMIERMLLPRNDEDHMPPKEKPQMTAQEISLLHWWISNGADFNKKVKELPQTEKEKSILLALQTGIPGGEQKTSDVPDKEVAKADQNTILRLQKAGVVVLPVAHNSNYLSANFVTASSGADSLIKLLEPLKEQLVWLKLDHAQISDSSIAKLGKLTALTRLHLSNTNITDKGLAQLQTLHQLQFLNLTNTQVSAQGMAQLGKLKKLKHLFLYQTAVKRNDWAMLQKTFPATKIDSGNYIVNTLATDTMVVTKAPRQKVE